ncbi:MAG: hypothetical protein AVDCRST_MAG93-4889, partial [uncultured Chloroflexia bacterium]
PSGPEIGPCQQVAGTGQPFHPGGCRGPEGAV